MKAADWIDQAKEACGWESDYRAAKELGLSKNTISNYRHRTPTLDDETAAKIAAALDLEPHIIVLDQVAERTKSDAVRTSLAGLLARLAKPKARSGGGGKRVDITSITQGTHDGGDPARLHTQYASYPRPAPSVGGLAAVVGQWLRAALPAPQPAAAA
jgi:transcriptional regulator with XRE-family HTH domain